MKNIIKKFSLIVTTFVLLFMFTGKVNAAASTAPCGADEKGCWQTQNRAIRPFGDEEFSYNGIGPYGRKFLESTADPSKNLVWRSGYISGGYGGFNQFYDAFTSVYCMDIQHPGDSSLRALRVMLNPKSAKNVQAFDVAAVSALTRNKRSTGHDILGPLENGTVTEYWVRLMAMRSLVYIWGWLFF